MFDLITLGDSMIDTFITIDSGEATLRCVTKREDCQLCLNYAEKIPIKYASQSIGGNAPNVAVGAHLLGLKTGIATELGDDLNGYFIKDELQKKGLGVDLVKLTKNRETRYSVILSYEGERTVLSHFTKHKYSGIKLPKTNWLYYTSLGYSFENLQKTVINLKKTGCKLAVNPGSFQIKYKLSKIKQVLPFTDILFVNKEEAQKIVGQEKNIKDLFKALFKTGVKIAVITDSIRGAFAGDQRGCYFMPTYPIKPIEKTGAGDAFASGFLSAIIFGKDLREAMEWGTANASGVIRKVGSQAGLLTRKQVQKIINKYPKVVPQKV